MVGRTRRRLWVAALVLVGLAAIPLANTSLRYSGVIVPDSSPEARGEALAPWISATWPDGAGPFPAALLFSGCDGPADNLTALAGALQAVGWASLIVDSHGLRGYEERAVWSLICAGQLFTGSERAGDVAVALDLARAMEEVDASRLALIGASHGGWAILDFLAYRDRGRVPPGLDDWPESFGRHGLTGLTDMVLLYPYCGPGARVWRWGWHTPIHTRFLLVDDDSIASEGQCRRVAQRAASRGVPVEITMFEGVTHGFDQRTKAPMSPLAYDADAHARAIGLTVEALAGPQ